MAAVPTTLCSFWHDPDDTPAFVARCLANLRRVHARTAWTVVVLSDADVPADRADVRALAPCHRADWIRLRWLAQHGGVWMDSTCVCFAPVDCWVDRRNADGWDLQGFATSFDADLAENWALAAPRGNAFVAACFDAFDLAVRTGFEWWCSIHYDEIPPSLKHGFLPYLTMHAVIAVLRRRLGGRVRLLPPVPLGVQIRDGWDGAAARRLATGRDVAALCGGCFCKLRSVEWRALSVDDLDPASDLGRWLGDDDDDVTDHVEITEGNQVDALDPRDDVARGVAIATDTDACWWWLAALVALMLVGGGVVAARRTR